MSRRKCRQLRPRAGWAQTGWALPTSSSWTRCFLYFIFFVNFPLDICHCQQCSTMTLTPPLLSGTRGSLHPWEQTLLARRFRPHPKCHRCWEVISSYIVIDENSLAKEPSNTWSSLSKPGIFLGGFSATLNATLTGSESLNQEIKIFYLSFKTIYDYIPDFSFSFCASY